MKNKSTLERFGDVEILFYEINSFQNLTWKQKKLAYFLYEAARWGRDIIYDQNYKHNLIIRHTLEQIFLHYAGDRQEDNFLYFQDYLKFVWFSNGIHHFNSTEKFLPAFPENYFINLINNSQNARFNFYGFVDIQDFINFLVYIIFNPEKDFKRVNQEKGCDLVTTSANNFYENITQQEVEDFYKKLKNTNENQPIEYGLNSKLVKENNHIFEKTAKLDGLYGKALSKIVFWLQKAAEVAENEQQQNTIATLIKFYQTGDLKIFDEFSIKWVNSSNTTIDFINGFIETYGDPMGIKATWESVVSVKDEDTTKFLEVLSKNAGWFENFLPILPQHKKEKVEGVSFKVIEVITGGGDCSPTLPLGINLPNSEWIREIHGSKSVSLSNVETAYHQSNSKALVNQEFHTPEQQSRIQNHAFLASRLHTALHEVIGHGSGRLMSGVATPSETLKSYASTIEEARADLVGLYFLLDTKLEELGLVPSLEVGKNQYDMYIVNGLMKQLFRIKKGNNLEEAHMRNRQLIAKWAYENGKNENVIERICSDNKTFFKINNYEKLRNLFGILLKEIQRIKSEGDGSAAEYLVENYGVKVDADLHNEVLLRCEPLKITPYSGFVNPYLTPIYKNNEIIDINIHYPTSFTEQMLFYSQNYSSLI